jgi:choline dehydrogenase-like flavoprotein
MLIDSTTVATDGVIEADICIIGAGPAGITLAREFIGSSLRVVLLESGKFENDEHIQELGQGKVNSQYYGADALAVGRRRQFGGTPNTWVYTTEPGDGRAYARCLPPEALDFESHADEPSLCWPFSLDQLRPFFQRAQTVWNGGRFDYEVDTWAGGLRPIETANGLLDTRICQHGPNDVFILRYRDDLLSADNIDVYLTCTAVALESHGAAGQVRKLSVARGDGRTFSVAAKTYVLACGGVENVQLLLSSVVTQPGAEGNRHSNIGHYVTDHPEFRMGCIFPNHADVYEKIALYDIRWSGRHMVSGFLTICEELKRSAKLLNMSVALAPQGPGFGTEAHRAIAGLAHAIQHGEMPSRLSADIGSILRSPLDTVAFLRSRNAGWYSENRGGWSRPDANRKDFRAIELWSAFEETPHRDNRLSLIKGRDWLGRKKLRFDHCWSEVDRENVQRSIKIFTAEIETLGLGRFEPYVGLEGPSRPRFVGLHHPMGGTRMHVDPRFGVVDQNCLVHGLSNVYVAGSSVFPTGVGYANPTLTLLTLAMRLADHLKASLRVAGR